MISDEEALKHASQLLEYFKTNCDKIIKKHNKISNDGSRLCPNDCKFMIGGDVLCVLDFEEIAGQLEKSVKWP